MCLWRMGGRSSLIKPWTVSELPFHTWVCVLIDGLGVVVDVEINSRRRPLVDVHVRAPTTPLRSTPPRTDYFNHNHNHTPSTSPTTTTTTNTNQPPYTPVAAPNSNSDQTTTADTTPTFPPPPNPHAHPPPSSLSSTPSGGTSGRAASSALARALSLASKKLFGQQQGQGQRPSPLPISTSSSPSTREYSPPLDVDGGVMGVGGGGGGENDPMEDVLLEKLEQLAQKTDVITRWADEMYEYVKAVPQSAYPLPSPHPSMLTVV